MSSSSLTGRTVEWMPNGFPPRSFPPGGTLPPPAAPPPPRPPRAGRGRWLAAAAAFVALLLLIAGLVAARRGDGGGDDDLVAGSTTSAVETSLPAFDATTTPFAPAPSIEPVTTAPGATTTVVPGGLGTVAPGELPPVPAGVLEPSLAVLALPKADATAGAARGTLMLRNTGGSPVTYTVTSSAAGLSAAPARGILSPATAAIITVTLDAARVDAEGPFGGTLTFGGAEVAKTVQVQSVVGRPPQITDGVGEPCPGPSANCSRQIKLAPTADPAPSPCNTPWLYSVLINDQSRIQTSRVIARLGAANADAQLRRGGTSNIFQSVAFPPLPPGAVLRFTVEAIDEHGFGRRLAEEMIACT